MSNKTDIPDFTIEQLVAIGDAIHTCKTAIILAENEVDNNRNVTVCIRGTRSKLKSMMYRTLKSNPEFEEICLDAMISLKNDRLNKSFRK